MAEGRILYDDGRIKINQADSPDEHEIYVDNSYLFVPRGVMKEWAEADSSRIRQGLVAMGQGDFPPHSESPTIPISLDKLGWACAKARIRELEEEVGYFCAKARE